MKFYTQDELIEIFAKILNGTEEERFFDIIGKETGVVIKSKISIDRACYLMTNAVEGHKERPLITDHKQQELKP